MAIMLIYEYEIGKTSVFFQEGLAEETSNTYSKSQNKITAIKYEYD